MSGPIVRKYGFPNHDQIFGAKPVEHGIDEESTEAPAEAEPKGSKSKTKTSPTKAAKPKSKKA
mgnify:CR=1 FL=1